MKVNFNNVRKQALMNYISLVEKLNSTIDERLDDDDCYRSKMVKIEVDSIQKELDNLRFQLITICCTYDDERGEDFKDLSDEIPDDVISFNPEE